MSSDKLYLAEYDILAMEKHFKSAMQHIEDTLNESANKIEDVTTELVALREEKDQTLHLAYLFSILFYVLGFIVGKFISS